LNGTLFELEAAGGAEDKKAADLGAVPANPLQMTAGQAFQKLHQVREIGLFVKTK